MQRRRYGAALDYAEAMTITDRGVDDALFDRLRTFFDEAEIVELTGLIAFQNMVEPPGPCSPTRASEQLRRKSASETARSR